jgi:hypothetical protein
MPNLLFYVFLLEWQLLFLCKMIFRQLRSHYNKEAKEMNAVNWDMCTVSRDQSYITRYGGQEGRMKV